MNVGDDQLRIFDGADHLFLLPGDWLPVTSPVGFQGKYQNILQLTDSRWTQGTGIRINIMRFSRDARNRLLR